MYDELKANVFSKLPKGIVQMSVFVREMKQSTLISSHHRFPHLILTYFKTLAYFFYNTRVELKLPKKNVCKTFCNTFCTILGQQPCKPKGKKLMNILVSCLWTTSSDIASVSFWVTVALFVLCPFVKLFLNVYTWFSNCLFCTFNFIIKQCKLSPWCLEDHIV